MPALGRVPRPLLPRARLEAVDVSSTRFLLPGRVLQQRANLEMEEKEPYSHPNRRVDQSKPDHTPYVCLSWAFTVASD